MSTIWSGKARPRRGTKPRRLEHPETARFLLYPNGAVFATGKGQPGPDPAELEAYARAWDAIDDAARAVKQAEVDARWEAERRRTALEDLRVSLSGPQRRVLEELGNAPAHYAVWWERLEAWLAKNPPAPGHGSVSDPERRIDEYDVFLREEETRRALRPRRGWPKGKRHSQETIDKITRIRREREEEGTWGRRGRTLRKEHEAPSYEQLAKED